MRRLKTIIPTAGILLLVFSAASLYVAMRDISKVRPAENYEDQGVRSFAPYAVYPVQVQNTGASGRDRRMNPAETLCMVCYLATDGSGCKWSDEALTRELGEDIVEAGEIVERRVLAIPADRSYITVEPDQTAESYAEGLRGKYIRTIGLSTLYILFYFIVLILSKLLRHLRQDRAEDTEPERTAVPREVSTSSRFSPELEKTRRFRLPESWSGWRQEPGGIEVRKPPRIPFRMKLSLLILAAAFLLFVFQRLGSSAPPEEKEPAAGQQEEASRTTCSTRGAAFRVPADWTRAEGMDMFYAVILHNQRLVTAPEEVREGGNSTLYIGFYLPELEMADLTSCDAGSNTQWTFQEKTI